MWLSLELTQHLCVPVYCPSHSLFFGVWVSSPQTSFFPFFLFFCDFCVLPPPSKLLPSLLFFLLVTLHYSIFKYSENSINGNVTLWQNSYSWMMLHNLITYCVRDNLFCFIFFLWIGYPFPNTRMSFFFFFLLTINPVNSTICFHLLKSGSFPGGKRILSSSEFIDFANVQTLQVQTGKNMEMIKCHPR